MNDILFLVIIFTIGCLGIFAFMYMYFSFFFGDTTVSTKDFNLSKEDMKKIKEQINVQQD